LLSNCYCSDRVECLEPPPPQQLLRRNAGAANVGVQLPNFGQSMSSASSTVSFSAAC
jgi:hypothetical protein